MVRCVAGADGLYRVTVRLRGRQIARGALRLAYGKAGIVRARLTPAGKRLLRGESAPRVTLVIEVPGERTRKMPLTLR